MTSDLVWSARGPVGVVLQAERRLGGEILRGLAPLVVRGQPIWVVDGCNRFDPYAFATAARQVGVDPRQALARVRVTRCFTIHQMQAVAEDLLPSLCDAVPLPFVLVLGLEGLFHEESIPLWERRQVLERTVRRLAALCRSRIQMLVTHTPPDGAKAWWLPHVREIGHWWGDVALEGERPRLLLQARAR